MLAQIMQTHPKTSNYNAHFFNQNIYIKVGVRIKRIVIKLSLITSKPLLGEALM